MPWGEFGLQELNLDLFNIRTGKQADPRAAMQALIGEQKSKLVNLALDILKMGRLSPGEPIWVTADPDNPGKQVVLEGNRRVAALKLMENPRQAEGTELAGSFNRLAKEFEAKPIRILEAQVFASREEAWPWIERRHMNATSGVALQRWRSLAKERTRVGDGKAVRRSLLVLDFLDDDTDEFGELGAIIEQKSTTVDRVLNHPLMKSMLGVTIDRLNREIIFENGDEIAGRRLLKDIILEFAKPDFTFSKVRDEADREIFLKQFANRSVLSSSSPESPTPPAPFNRTERAEPSEPNDPPEPAEPSGKESGGARAAARTSSTRKGRLNEPVRGTLAPKAGARTISTVAGPRLNKIYRECREIRVEGNENAAAFLLRVFLELSSEAFLIEKKVPLPQKHLGKKTYWGEFGITLEDKINAVMPLIDLSRESRNKLKSARIAIADKDRAGSVDTLHSYVHNLDLTPLPDALRAAWDTWETYLTLLHGARL